MSLDSDCKSSSDSKGNRSAASCESVHILRNKFCCHVCYCLSLVDHSLIHCGQFGECCQDCEEVARMVLMGTVND